MPKLIVKIAALLLMTGTVVQARDVSTIVIGYGEWPPYESDAFPNLGPVPLLTAEAFALGGTHVEFKSLPWWRMLHDLEMGQLDGALMWRDVGDRRAAFLLSDAILKSRISLFYRKGEIRPWRKLSELSNVRIGATASYRYCAEFDQLEEQGRLTVERAAADDLNFAMLKAGRVDAMLVDSEYGRWRLTQLGDSLGQIVEDKHPVCITPLYLLISRAVEYGPELADRFNAGLRQLKAEGRFDQLFDGIEH